MTVATVIYYSGYHPYTLKKSYVPKSKKEKDEQHRFFFWYKKENRNWIRNTLQKVGKNDLIERLLPSDNIRSGKSFKKQKEQGGKNDGYTSVLKKKRKPSRS